MAAPPLPRAGLRAADLPSGGGGDRGPPLSHLAPGRGVGRRPRRCTPISPIERRRGEIAARSCRAGGRVGAEALAPRAAAGVPQPDRPPLGRASPTAAPCACCATTPASPAPPTSRSIWRRCSARGSTPTSSCSTCCCTAAACRSRASRPKRPGWRSGGGRARRAAPAPWTSCAAGWRRPSGPWARGFIEHPANEALRRRLQSGELGGAGLLPAAPAPGLPPPLPARRRGTGPPLRAGRRARARKRSTASYYGVDRLRDLARRRSTDRHDDLWQGMQVLFRALREEEPAELLGLAPLGGLFDSREMRDVDGRQDAERRGAVGERPPAGGPARARLAGDRRHAAPHQLPRHGRRGAGQRLRGAARAAASPARRRASEPSSTWALSGERKTTGSYYTNPGLVRELIRSALEPAIDGGAGEGGHEGGEAPPPAGSEGLRPRLRQRPLPAGGGAADRAGGGRGRRRRRRALARGRAGRHPRGDRALHLRRRSQPAGGRPLQGGALAGGAERRQTAAVPRPPHPARQLAGRRDRGGDGEGHPRRRLRPGHRRRQDVRGDDQEDATATERKGQRPLEELGVAGDRRHARRTPASATSPRSDGDDETLAEVAEKARALPPPPAHSRLPAPQADRRSLDGGVLLAVAGGRGATADRRRLAPPGRRPAAGRLHRRAHDGRAEGPRRFPHRAPGAAAVAAARTSSTGSWSSRMSSAAPTRASTSSSATRRGSEIKLQEQEFFAAARPGDRRRAERRGPQATDRRAARDEPDALRGLRARQARRRKRRASSCAAADATR